MSDIIPTEEVDDTRLGHDQLDAINHYLSTLGRDNVTKLGQALGLRYTTLRDLPHGEFLNEVMTLWLDEAEDVLKKGNPSWRSLVQGLRNKIVQQNGIANRIAADHRMQGANPASQGRMETDSGSDSKPAKMELNDRNILNVLHEAEFADAHWELLGKQLIKRSALLNIRANRLGDPSLCMIDTVAQWLRTDLEASWEKLAEAVAKVQQYEEATANTIRQKAGIAVSNDKPPERDQSKGKRSATAGGKRVVEDSAEEEEVEEGSEQDETDMAMCLTYMHTPEAGGIVEMAQHPSKQSAFFPDPGKLWTTSEIKVWFMNRIPDWRYGDDPITKEKILQWANEWSEFDVSGGNPVPKFVLAKTQPDSDIRVEFAVDGACWSEVGTAAKQRALTEATMHLDLGRGYDDYKRHLVLHEFGHVLGLGHEHQSPNAPSFIDDTKAKQHLTEGYKNTLKNSKAFKDQLKKKYGPQMSDEKMAENEAEQKFDIDYGQKSGGESSEYDPNSIMHYWIPESWLKQEYKHIARKSESQLRKKKEKEMKRRLTTLASKLSEVDKQMIIKKYQGLKNFQPQERRESNGKRTEVAGPDHPKRAVVDSDEPSEKTEDAKHGNRNDTSKEKGCYRWICGGVLVSAVLVLVMAVGLGLLTTPAQPQPEPPQREPYSSPKRHPPPPSDSPTIPPSPDNNCHPIARKQDLFKELADIGNWEALCTNLEVPEATLDGLVHAHLENTAKKQRCLAAYFDQGNACWEKVIEVVAGYPFYKKKLAKQIAEKYGVTWQE